jgi:hypothetical protein
LRFDTILPLMALLLRWCKHDYYEQSYSQQPLRQHHFQRRDRHVVHLGLGLGLGLD